MIKPLTCPQHVPAGKPAANTNQRNAAVVTSYTFENLPGNVAPQESAKAATVHGLELECPVRTNSTKVAVLQLVPPDMATSKFHTFADLCAIWCEKPNIVLCDSASQVMSVTGDFKACQMNRFLNRKNPLGFDDVMNALCSANFLGCFHRHCRSVAGIDSWMASPAATRMGLSQPQLERLKALLWTSHASHCRNAPLVLERLNLTRQVKQTKLGLPAHIRRRGDAYMNNWLASLGPVVAAQRRIREIDALLAQPPSAW